MEFTSFTELVREEISKKMGDGYNVQLNDVRKNNGIMLRGLTVLEDNNNISPTIYLNQYFDMYANGKMTFTDVVNGVIDTYHQNKISKSTDLRHFLNYGQVKPRIIYKVINTEKNRELLEDIPHVEFLDLSIVFEYMVDQEGFGVATILIHNTHQKMWNVTTDMLYQAAIENTQELLPYEIKPMTEILCELMEAENPDQFDHDACMEEFSDSVPMYVLSNKSRVEGAVCMLYPDILRNFAEATDSDYYIIPSSIHELLLLPVGEDDESGEIKGMIKNINDTQVSNEEILSYSLYFYNREMNKIVRL